MYSTLLHFWPVVELAELVDSPAECVDVRRGGCLFAWNFSVTSSTVLTEAERRNGPNMMLSVH
jgi:hypothetical protein